MAATVKEFLLNEATKIAHQAEAENRPMTKAERDQVEKSLDSVQAINDQEEVNRAFDTGNFDNLSPGARKQLDEMSRKKASDDEARARYESIVRGGAASSTGGAFTSALKSANFHYKEHPSVEVPTMRALGLKSTFPGEETWAVSGPEIVPSGMDSRWLFRNLPSVDSSGVSAINDFRQTARSLSGTVKRALDATSDKATVDVTLTSVTEPLVQFAVVIPDIPNDLFDSMPKTDAFLRGQGTFEVEKALDAHVVSQIITAGIAGVSTGGDLITQIRNAVAGARAEGANPTLLALDPADAADLDLETGTGTEMLFPTRNTGSASPLFGLKVIESVSMIGKSPILIDPDMLGVLYLGTMHVDADPFTGFKKNLTNLRVEVKALYHVRNILGAYIIGAS